MASTATDEKFLSLDEVADKLRVSRSTMIKLQNEGKISGLKVRGQYRYLFSEVVEQLKNCPDES